MGQQREREREREGYLASGEVVGGRTGRGNATSLADDRGRVRGVGGRLVWHLVGEGCSYGTPPLVGRRGLLVWHLLRVTPSLKGEGMCTLELPSHPTHGWLAG